MRAGNARASKGPARVLLLVVLGAVVAPGAAQGPGTEVVGASLPRRPEQDCQLPAVVAAVTKCGLLGVNGTSCCAGLDAVFADESSPSYGCLCYPAVLYTMTMKAAQVGFDMPGILRQCRTLSNNFTTQWDSANPTGCPQIPMDANAVTMAPIIGSATLASRHTAPGWSWQNLVQLGEAASWHPHVDVILGHVFGVMLVQMALGVLTALPLVFAALYWALSKSSSAYRVLPEGHRLVTLQHSVYAVLFGLSMVPQACLTLQALFGTATGSLLASNGLTYLVGLFTGPRLFLYFVEAAARSVTKPSFQLVGLRAVSLASWFVVVLTKNPAGLTMTMLMDLGAAFEAPLYATLVVRRLQWRMSLTRRLLWASVAWYGVIRVFQLVVLVYMVVGFAAMPAVNTTSEFIVLSIVYMSYSVFGSLHTLAIYRRLDIRLGSENMPELLPNASNQK